ncbi:MAG: pyrroline-5-carboxylate reductase [Oscillospiraceae bacterium]|nr:pyrroline-5-carboxylate reductase [Oscillospiraceae bacterium]
MHDFMLGVIGAGNMGSAILQGALSAGIMLPQQVWIANPHIERLSPFGDMGVMLTTSNSEAVKHSDIILLAVKPQRMTEVAEEIAPYTAGKCIVSIAAGISQSWLRERFPNCPVICLMPNTPLMLGCGASAMTERGDVPEEIYDYVYRIFSSVGLVEILPADRINEIIPVSGSSPAFFFRMVDLMVQAAGQYGIDPDTALKMAAKTMEGSARMLLSSGKTAKELERQVCSPGGTTLAGLTAFDELEFDRMISLAFERCVRRAYELGK